MTAHLSQIFSFSFDDSDYRGDASCKDSDDNVVYALFLLCKNYAGKIIEGRMNCVICIIYIGKVGCDCRAVDCDY